MLLDSAANMDLQGESGGKLTLGGKGGEGGRKRRRRWMRRKGREREHIEGMGR